MALPAARKYASVASSSAHALHMPSHIFTRLGLWDESVQSNLSSMAAAQCYAEAAGIDGNWDEELHAIDYLVYAYLQKDEDALAKNQVDYLASIKKVTPINFKAAYTFAAVPSRYILENRLWKEATELQPREGFSWKGFEWQKAIIHFTRALGYVHTGNLEIARAELGVLRNIHQLLLEQKDAYKANQVLIQATAAEAWILFKEGKIAAAEALMKESADLEERTEKHPVTPGEVLPARELLGDLYMEMKQPQKALMAYQQNLVKHPNRLNGLLGAAKAAELAGDPNKVKEYKGKIAWLKGGEDLEL
jgi:tetratricopeptide (TPR) repeat protein